MRISKVFQPYGECTHDLNEYNSYDSEFYRKTLENYKYYQQKDCLSICLQEHLVQELNCYTTLIRYNSSNINPCTNTKDIIAAIQWIQQFFLKIPDDCNEGCPLECNSEKNTFASSSLDYSSKVYADLIRKKEVIMRRYGNRTPTYDDLKNSIMKLNINYQELAYTLVEESQKTTWLDLLSNVGGTLGLFTGFSFLSVVEFFEIIFEIALYKKTKIVPKRNDKLFI